ncbi:uncharacterized protein LOC125840604 [Solanum verrucosum]|uniref:uncharacterized protein LOC125840604 n=1 Tax=Solanum verrucosum TaxID=315347 RepID=UPI0020D0D49D|nr:uncharacterized protein LOC125840604 [Solanum verrucosum]
MWALRALNLDLAKTSKERVEQLNELDKFRFKAYKSSALFKEKMKKWHDAKILKREFKVGDWVLLYNSRLKLFPRKLKLKWSGPFRVTQVFPNGIIEVEGQEGHTFKVDGQRLKLYFCECQEISLIEFDAIQIASRLSIHEHQRFDGVFTRMKTLGHVWMMRREFHALHGNICT